MEKISVTKGGILVENKTFRWEIQNFDIIVKSEDLLKQQQQLFEITDANGVKYCWQFWFNYGEIDAEEEDVAVDDEKTKIEEKEKAVKLMFALLEKPGYSLEMVSAFAIKIEDADGTVIVDSQLTDPSNYRKTVTERWFWALYELSPEKDLKLADGTIFVTITLKAFTKVEQALREVEVVNVDDKRIQRNRQKQFYRDIAKLENDKKNSDVKIISNDGQKFYAYRWILSGASDVFDAMFRSDMKERETGMVKLDDLAGTTVKLLLHFIYTGKVGPKWSLPGNVAELAYAADKYQIDDLKNYLDSNIGKICTVKNAGNLLILAKKMSMKQATAEILLFIREKCKNAEDTIDFMNCSNYQ